MYGTTQSKLSYFAVLSSAVLGIAVASNAAAARDMSSSLAPAVNGLNRMSSDICHSLKLKCTQHQATRKPAPSKPAQKKPAQVKPAQSEPAQAKADTTPKPRETAAASPERRPAPLTVPKPELRPAKVASTEQPSPVVPIPRARPAAVDPAPPQVQQAAAPPDVQPERAAEPAKDQAKVAAIEPVPAAPSASGDCERELRNSKVEFEPLATSFGDASCPVADPVRLQSVQTPSGLVSFPEGPVFNCRFARQFAQWISDTGSAVVLAQTNKRLEKVATGPGYDCRHRNGDSSGKMSEHAAGDAVDITTVTLADGTTIRIADAINPNSPSYGLLRALRTTACGYFTTVLGPGTNEAHKEHYHLDLGVHGKSGNYRICE